MAYTEDPYDNSIVINGWEQGIADDPYDGISDMRNINIVSVPGEASVGFSTAQISPVNHGTTTILSADATADTITLANNQVIGSGQAVTFSGGSLPSGLVAGTIYWVDLVSAATYKVYTGYGLNVGTLVNITSNGTGTVTPVAMAKPKYFVFDTTNYWMVDASGQVWSNTRTTVDPVTTATGYWTFTGNRINNFSNGNGLAFYPSQNLSSAEVGYIMVFSNGSIDITSTGIVNSTNVSWHYQWTPLTGVYAGYNANPTNVLQYNNNVANHSTFLAPDNTLYYCDGSAIGQIFQTDTDIGGAAFDPTNTATYTFDPTPLLPTNDVAQCITFLGTNLLIGGRFNVLYPWDTTSPTFTSPVLLAENNIVQMITVNTNTYVLAGSRGRIYITNGSQAQLLKKIPDHISGTIEPYYTWGGLAANRNQLYFSFSVTTNSGSTISQYGGIWGLDLDTKAIRLVNQLSYGTYAGYAPAVISVSGTPSGTGFFAGWDNGSSVYGIDKTSSIPYTGSQSTVDSDLIPIGSFEKPKNFNRIEYKLTKPMVSGESITIYQRLIFNTTDTGYTQLLTDSTVGNFSSSGPVNFSNAQWLQFKVVLNSTASSPSFTRLKEIRITQHE